MSLQPGLYRRTSAGHKNVNTGAFVAAGEVVVPPDGTPPPALGETLLGINQGAIDSTLTNAMGLRLPAVRTYHAGGTGINTGWTANSTEREWFDSGYLPLLSIQPLASVDGRTSHGSVAFGSHDTAIRDFFRRAHQLPWGTPVNGNRPGANYGGNKADHVWFHYRHEPDVPDKWLDGSASNNEAEAAATFCAAWERVWDIRNEVENDPVYNPLVNGVKKRRVFMAPIYTPTYTRMWPSNGTTPWIPDANKMDALGYDPYWPSVGAWLNPTAPMPWIESTAQGRLARLVLDVNTKLRPDLPIVLGEYRIARSETVENGGVGLDPNRNVSTGAWSGQSMRRRFMLDPTQGMVAVFKKYRLPDGRPRFPVACWFYFARTGVADQGSLDPAVDPVGMQSFAESTRALGLTY